MTPRRRRLLQQAIIFLAQPPPDITEYNRLVLHVILLLCRLSPDPLLDIRHRLSAGDDMGYGGRDVFGLFSQKRYQFFEMTGETPDTFIALVNSLDVRENISNNLSKRNRFLLVFIWLRSYPCYSVLSSLFNVSVSTVKNELNRLIPVLDKALERYLRWPNVTEWLSLKGYHDKIPCAVGAIDGTSHEIYRPVQNQQQYYSGHRNFHCLHSQIITDNTGIIRHIQTGFLGHLNDAQQFMLMTNIGDELPFPDSCVLLGDKIYANRHPVMTPFSSAQIRRKVGNEKHQALRLNRYIAKYRIQVEHAVAELKIYRCTSSICRHPRNFLSRTVRVCAKLVCRRKDLGLIL